MLTVKDVYLFIRFLGNILVLACLVHFFAFREQAIFNIKKEL